MKTNTKIDIFEFIKTTNPTSVNQIKDKFNLSNQIIHRHIKKLIEEGSIYKVWTPPKVFYFSNIKNWITDSDSVITSEWQISIANNSLLNDSFVYFWPDWVLKYWEAWFNLRCEKKNLDKTKELDIYIKTLEKYNKYKDENWFIDWLQKMKTSFHEVYLDEVFYLDFYSIEKYGKTLLGNLMLYAKQTWSKGLANTIIEKIKSPIYKLLNLKKIDSFAFIPPSIDRKIQLMDLLKKWLSINKKELKLMKIFRDTPVPQKSLNKLEDRIQNAKDTIFVKDRDFKSDTILLIDDAIWSWSTLNETAKKIKEQKIAKKVIWLAIVWSYKWFEVISEI